jgi:amino acid adenylation domain-containing protein/non-ribosomal peptide synthase protein (TIGR01720 family)
MSEAHSQPLPKEPVHRLFERAAQRFPGHAAVESRGVSTTYRELDERANGLARFLLDLGTAPGSFVGVLADDTLDVVTSLLAALKAGCGFVPLDPAMPDQRFRDILAEVDPALVLAEERFVPRLAEVRPDVRVVGLGAIGPVAQPPEVPSDPDARCYVYFTSGSTGRPKGIVGRLKAIDHFIRWEVETLGLGPGVRVSQLITPAFDAFLRDVFVPLAVGGTICAPESREVILDAARLVEFLDRERIEVVHCVPTLFRSLLGQDPAPERFPALRYLLMAGERLLPADVARWTDVFGDRVQLVNLYGPSETTMTKFCYFVQSSDRDLRAIPIGKPIRGAEAMVLDAKGRPSPPGTVGEICIRTPFRSHGYLNRPDLDREVFIPNPLTGDPADLLYRTGDFGRLLKDGNFEYLGRRDQQVKVRGVRVELAEVEEVLRRHPGVRDLVVIDREDAEGNVILCAYVVGDESARGSELRELCARSLPETMIPSVFIPMETLPRTLSGKVDRKSLPAPADVLGSRQRTFVAPRTEMEKALAAIWSEVLGLAEIGVEDNFFELGGHSLLATRVLTRVRAAFEVVVPLRVLFQRPTLAGLAEVVEQARGTAGGESAAPLVRVPRDVDHPASFAQERLWFLQRLEPESVAYNMAALVRLEGALDVAALRRSLAEVVRRHEALRTTFPERDGRPVQRIAPPAEARIEMVDLAAVAAPREEALRLARAAAQRPFDLERGPLLRLTLMRLGERAHAVSVVVHHIVSDLWSMEIFTREVAELYEAFAAGRPAPLPELPVQLVDFAVWQRGWLQGEVLARELAFWRQRLQDALDPLLLPTDRPRPALRSSRGAQRGFRLPRPLVDELSALGRGEEATLFSLLLGAFQLLLGRYTGDSAVSVGSPVAGRDRLEIEGVIGFFINTLILRTPLEGEASFREIVRRAQATVLEAHAHQSLPLELLMDELRPERELSHTPLFQVWFTFRDRPRETLHTSGLALSAQGIDHGAAKWDLALFMGSEEDGAAGHFEYDRDLFDEATIDRMIGHFETLLGGAVQEPDSRAGELPLLGPAERRQLLEEWNRPAASGGETRRLHEIFTEQVARTPNALAAVCDVDALTYGELDTRANRLARRLLREGVGPDVPVGLLAERSLDLVVGLLGILKAGGGYLPLDPGHPRERIAHALSDSGARVLVAQPHLFEQLALEGGLVAIDPADPEVARLSGDPLPVAGEDLSGTLAYVIYTSGSTGTPKGTPVSHAHVTRLFTATEPYFRFRADDVWTLFHSVAFDFSVWELWGALLHGGRVVVVPSAVSRSPKAFHRLLVQEEVTMLSQTPSAFRQLVQADEEAGEESRGLRLRFVVFGGEALEVAALRPWWERHAEDRPRLVNMYGITETTVHVTLRPLAPADLELPARSPIGVPISDFQVHVLDRSGQLAPVGVPGEIRVGGAGVARGYLGRPELTAERFVPDHLSGRPGARLYRSGDLGRWLAAGELESLGRIDHQVKIRGFRIELGEIESALSAQPSVREALVLPLRDGSGDLRLVAYVVPRPGAAPALRDLRESLAARLPEYMLPAGLVTLEAMPLTPNGKVDRRALARIEPALAALPETAGAEPATPLEELLAGIWTDVLGAPRIGRQDNFFGLGGHSLLATRVVSRLRQVLGVEVPLLSLFEEPVLAGFARRVEQALALRQAVLPPVTPVDRAERLPLSFAQQRLWFLQRLEPGSCAYNLPLAVRIAGRLEAPALERSLAEIVRRHEVLRTGFPEEEGRGWQRVEPAVALALPGVDLSALPRPLRDEEERRLTAAVAREPFDLARPPLLRALLLRGGPDEHLAAVVLHHIVSDEWSHGVLLAEIAALYGAFRDGQGSPLPDLPVQYGDFVVWQRRWLEGAALGELLAYWRPRVAGVPALELPFDRPRGAIQTFRGTSRTLALPEDLDAPLQALARREGATPFMIFLAAFRGLLSRYSGQEDVAVGTPIANRNRAEIEPLIGFFVNTLVLRVGVGGDPSFRESVARERAAALEAYAHQDLPFERLVEAVQPERDLARTPLFQVMFVLHNAPLPALELPGMTLSPVGVETGTAKLDLTLFTGLREGRWEATVESNADLFDAATVDRLGRHFRTLLESALAAPERPLAEVDLLSGAERRQLLEWSGAESLPAAPPLVHRLFEEQVRRDPEAVAVESAEEILSFAELNRQANRLAHFLIARGVGPEVPVAVALERSPDLVAALLGVLKAGGAYVPLDPAHPDERLTFMATAAAAPLVITRQALAERLAGAGSTMVVLDEHPEIFAAERAEDPAPRATGDNLAYVLFTSGSTGRPKGVMIGQGAFSRYVAWAVDAYRVREGLGAPLHTSIGFDLSITSLFVPLAAGRRVALLREEEGGESLVEALERAPGFSLVKLTPAHLEILSHRLRPAAAAASSAALVIGGEALHSERLAFWRRHAPATRLINEYGPTEAVVGCCLHEVAADEASTGAVPIGRPVPYTRLRVLDRRLCEVPAGVAGELCIGGAALARGYLGWPEGTAAAFTPDPLAETPGARLYRTGDLARYLPDGNLQFLGRIDQQVKVRGYRIEPAEIEAALLALPGIRDAVVLLREDLPGHPRLVAYLAAGGPAPAVSDLREPLARRLPSYMVPAAFVVLDELPLSVHGKVDRARLPAPELAWNEGRAAFEAPRTSVERVLAEVWCRVLRLEQVGIHDNFFEIGGDSILALQIVSQAGREGVRLTPRQMFQHQTIAALATAAGVAGAAADAGPDAAPVAGPVPLTPIQAWFFARRLPEPHHYNQSVLMELLLPLTPPVWERALARVVEHHDALRLRYRRGPAGSWEQAALPPDQVAPSVLRIDLSALPGADRARALESAAGQVQAGLDLEAGPLLRLALFDLAAGGPQRVLLAAHHLIVDGVSWEILLGDLESACLAVSGGTPPELPRRTTPFKTWAERLVSHAPSRDGELSHWLTLEGVAVPALPRDRNAEEDTEAEARTVWVGLGAEETRVLLQERLGELRCRIDEALLAAVLRAFSGWTGNGSLLIDLEGHGREEIADELDLTRTIGWFTSLSPLLLDGGAADDPLDVLRAVKERVRAVPSRGIGYGLLRELHPSPQVRERLRRLPQAEVSFNYLGQVGGSVSQSRLWRGASEPRGLERSLRQPRSHRLSIDGAVVAGELRLGWTYSSARYERGTIETLAGAFVHALRELLAPRDTAAPEIYTPSDFPDLDLDQEKLDRILQELEEI